MIINLNGEVNNKMFNSLLEALNYCIRENDALRIYLNSFGGNLADMEAIISLINEGKDFIELVGYGELMSAAFIIFFSAECEKSLLPNTVGMMHYPYTYVDIDARGKHKPNPSNSFNFSSLQEIKASIHRFIKTVEFSDTEVKLITNGGDAYFTHKRMKELLNGKGKSNSKGARKVRGKNNGISDVSETESNSNKAG